MTKFLKIILVKIKEWYKNQQINKQKQYWKRYGDYKRKHNEALKNSIKNK